MLAACNKEEAVPALPNAVWNSTEGFLVWVNDAPVDCSKGWPTAKSFLTFGQEGLPNPPGKTTYAKSQLSLCAQFGEEIAQCTDGLLHLEFNPARNEYTGSYEFKMTSGRTQRGRFRAEFCAPSSSPSPQ